MYTRERLAQYLCFLCLCGGAPVYTLSVSRTSAVSHWRLCLFPLLPALLSLRPLSIAMPRMIPPGHLRSPASATQSCASRLARVPTEEALKVNGAVPSVCRLPPRLQRRSFVAAALSLLLFALHSCAAPLPGDQKSAASLLASFGCNLRARACPGVEGGVGLRPGLGPSSRS